MCQRCTAWLAKSGAKALSAAIEDEARAIAENTGLRKVIRVMKKKYLVKWRGLSYRDSTWETPKDINDDDKILEYHKLNDSPPDDPPLTQAEMGIELSKDRRTQLIPALSRPSAVQDLDATIYAQIRALHFLRYQKIPPSALLRECGPRSLAYAHGNRTDMLLPVKVANTLETMKTSIQQHNATHSQSLSQKSTLVSARSYDYEGSDALTINQQDSNNNSSGNAGIQGINTNDHDMLVWTRPLVTPTAITTISSSSSSSANGTGTGTLFGYDMIRNEVADTLSSVVYCVARHSLPPSHPTRPRIPLAHPVRGGEIEVCVRKGPSMLGLKLGQSKKNTIVIGFRTINDRGQKGPVEVTGRVRLGDILISINGFSVTHLTCLDIIKLISEYSGPYIYLRFFRQAAVVFYEKTRVNVPVMPGVPAPMSSYNALQEYMENKPDYPSRKLPDIRSLFFGVFPVLLLQSDMTTSNNSSSTETINNVPKDVAWVAQCYNPLLGRIETIDTYTNELTAAKAYDAYKLTLLSKLHAQRQRAIQQKQLSEKNKDKNDITTNSDPSATPSNNNTSHENGQKQPSPSDELILTDALFIRNNINFNLQGQLTKTAQVLYSEVSDERRKRNELLQRFPTLTDVYNSHTSTSASATAPVSRDEVEGNASNIKLTTKDNNDDVEEVKTNGKHIESAEVVVVEGGDHNNNKDHEGLLLTGRTDNSQPLSESEGNNSNTAPAKTSTSSPRIIDPLVDTSALNASLEVDLMSLDSRDTDSELNTQVEAISVAENEDEDDDKSSDNSRYILSIILSLIIII